MRLKTIPEFYGMKRGEEQGGEISMSLEEYQNLTTKTRDLQELVNKRAAVGMAQVRFSLYLLYMFLFCINSRPRSSSGLCF